MGATGFGGRPAMVGERFQHFDHRRFDHRRFDHRRGFNTVVIAGGGGYAYPYAYYGGYDYSGYPGTPYSEPAYPGSYADYSGPVPDVSPGLVAGDVVGNVQRVLRYRGFYRGPIDGLSGPATRAAIRAYDASVGLPPTGMIDARLLISMQLM
ncbi:MAG: peptidoglycan-binding domain-containing protein [Verrucomicrobia bacterium]|nr:peptidoglycan-binding domain-containing protein [Verrucomicrobiota bacterium]